MIRGAPKRPSITIELSPAQEAFLQRRMRELCRTPGLDRQREHVKTEHLVLAAIDLLMAIDGGDEQFVRTPDEQPPDEEAVASIVPELS